MHTRFFRRYLKTIHVQGHRDSSTERLSRSGSNIEGIFVVPVERHIDVIIIAIGFACVFFKDSFTITPRMVLGTAR